MNLTDYTPAALATCEDSSRDLAYLIPGLIGEVGELFGEVARVQRLGQPRTEQIIDEYGDIAWMTAVLLDHLKVDDIRQLGNLRYVQGREAALELILARAAAVHRSGSDVLPGRAAALWATLADHAEAVTGVSFDEVLSANLEKLAARHG